MADTLSDKDLLAMEGERVLAAARDSLSDEMVSRLADTASDAMDLIDRINRTGLYRAIPALAELVNNGDLDRLAKLARVYSAAEDSLSDEMVGRLASTVSEGMSLLDRLNRGGAEHVVEMLEKLDASGALERMARVLPEIAERLELVAGLLKCVETAAAESNAAPHSTGGIGPVWRMMTDPENQDSLRFLMTLGKQLRQCASAGK